MSRIKNETIASQGYMLKTEVFEGKKLVSLTVDNVAKVEAMIRTDSKYRASFNANLSSNNPHMGSSAYWLTELKKKLIYNQRNDTELFQTIITGVVYSIDRENGTHLSSYGDSRDNMIRRICDFGKKELVDCLRNGKLDVFNKLAEETRGRKNISFASKFCHYVCMTLFSGEDVEDNYSIWDSVLRQVIPDYAKRYQIDCTTTRLMDYSYYRGIVDMIIEKSDSKMSRNGFDHLLWYYHKGMTSVVQ